MPSTSYIRELTLRASTPGVSEATNALNNLSGAQGRVAESARVMATQTDTTSRRTLSAVSALERSAAAHDEHYRASQKAAQGVALLERATAQGLSGSREFAILQAALTKAHNDNSAAVGLNRNQLLELTHVGKALFDEVASGGSILRGLTMESGRLGQVLAEGSGGVGGTVRALTGGVARLATGWVGLGVATAAAVGVGTASILSYVSAQDRLATSLEGTGRRAGLTLGQLNAVAAAGAGTAGISLGAGQSLAIGYAQHGFGGDLSQSLIGSSKRFGEITGQDTATAGAKLGDIFADPSRGASELNKTFGFLDARLQTTIDRLAAQGDLDGARMVALDAYTKAQAEITDRTWSFAKALHGAEDAVGSWFERTGHVLATTLGINSDADKLSQDRETLANLQKVDPVNNADYIGQLREEITRLERGQQQEAARARADAEAAKNRELSLKLDAGVKAALPDIMRTRGLEDRLGLLGRGIGTPGVAADMGLSGADMRSAFDRTAVQLAHIDPFKRMVEDARLATAGIEAYTLAERAAVEARRAELQVLREDGDLRRAALAARIAENEAIARANNAASDRWDQRQQDHALVGLSPAARGLQEIDNRYSGVGGFFDKDSTTRSELTNAMRPVTDDLRTAGETIAKTLQSYIPDRLSAAGDRLVSALDGITGKLTAGAPSPYGALNRDAFASPAGGAAGGAFGHAPAGVQAMITSASMQTGMPASIIAAIGEKENSFRLTGGTNIMGADGRPASSAFGFGQLTNGAAADVARAAPGFSKYDPSTAVFGTAEYLKILQGRFGDMQTALDHYGTGPGYGADILRRAGQGVAQAGGAGVPLTVHAASSVPPLLASTGRGVDEKSLASERGDYLSGLVNDPLKTANTSLEAYRANLAGEQATLGQSTAAIHAAADAQKLLNDYKARGVTQDVVGVDRWHQLTAGVDAYKAGLTQAYQAEDDFRKKQEDLIGAMDDVRSAGRSFADPFIDAAVHGTSAMKALHAGLQSVESMLLGKVKDSVFNSLLGAPGTTGAGSPLGGGLSSLFGGESPGAGLFASLGSGAGFANGGYTGSGSKYQPAGIVHAGEYVMDAASVGRIGIGALDAMRHGMRGYADGGYVTPASFASIPSGSPGGDGWGGDTHIHVQVNGAVGNTELHQITHSAVTSALASYDKALPGRMADQRRRAG